MAPTAAVFRRRRRHDLPAVAGPLRRTVHRRRRQYRRHQSPWLVLARRHLARRSPLCSSVPRPASTPADTGRIETLFGTGLRVAGGSGPRDRRALLERYPDAASVLLHPADAPFFVELCKTLGKPVNFVPVIDKGRAPLVAQRLTVAGPRRPLQRRSGLHHPGTAAVAGITCVDEPVGELLDRFEAAAVAEVLASGAEPEPVASRLQVRSDVSVRWASCLTRRTCCGPAAPPPTGAPAGIQLADWQVHDSRSATNHSTGSRLEVIRPADHRGWCGCRCREPGSTSPSRCPRSWSTAVPCGHHRRCRGGHARGARHRRGRGLT